MHFTYFGSQIWNANHPQPKFVRSFHNPLEDIILVRVSEQDNAANIYNWDKAIYLWWKKEHDSLGIRYGLKQK
jgi:hypothetical protein